MELQFTGGENADTYGYSVSLSAAGTTLAIGTPGAYSNVGYETGAVRVFNWTGVDWIQLHTCNGSDSGGTRIEN